MEMWNRLAVEASVPHLELQVDRFSRDRARGLNDELVSEFAVLNISNRVSESLPRRRQPVWRAHTETP